MAARKALVVDDSPSIRALVAATLKAAGFDVVPAGDGQSALSAADQIGGFDLVITDLNMPIMDGITFVRQLRTRAHLKYVPVLLLTTETSTSQKDKARAAGATGWLTKPFDPQKLLMTVQRVLP